MRIALPAHIDAHAFAECDPAIPVGRLDGRTMGTTWSLRFTSPHGTDDAAIRAAVERRLERILAEMSHWKADSLLCRFNRAEAASWTLLPPDFAAVIETALAVAEASGGAFDPAIGHLVDLWGYGPPGPCPAPDANRLAAARAVSGWSRLAWDAANRRLRQPGGVALDFSGIAKGYAVDAVADLLGTFEHHPAFIAFQPIGEGAARPGVAEGGVFDLEYGIEVRLGHRAERNSVAHAGA